MVVCMLFYLCNFFLFILFYLLFDNGILSFMFCFQPDCLDDLAYAIMYETTKLAYRVSEADVIRARNQVA